MDDRDRLGVLTLNIGSPSAQRAERQLEWLAAREEDVIVLTETCATAGTRLLGDRLAAAGWDVVGPALDDGERGVLVASRLAGGRFDDAVLAYLPSRAVSVRGAGVDVLGVYVPSRDESRVKIARKERFVRELGAAVRRWAARPAVLIGDLNVLEPDHRPRYAFFRDWEYGLYADLIADGWVDAYRRERTGPIEHSWVGPDDDGFRFDHAFVSAPLAGALRSCAMLHETRELGLTDHSALTVSVACGAVERLQIGSLSAEPLALF